VKIKHNGKFFSWDRKGKIMTISESELLDLMQALLEEKKKDDPDATWADVLEYLFDRYE